MIDAISTASTPLPVRPTTPGRTKLPPQRRRHTLKPGEPLLVGHLVLGEAPFRESTVPALMIDVWCPACRTWHRHGWLAEFPTNAANHRVAHCRSAKPPSPYEAGGYYVGLDPSPPGVAHSKAMLAAHTARVATWERWKERRQAGPAESVLPAIPAASTDSSPRPPAA
jgi:hypothetical protein